MGAIALFPSESMANRQQLLDASTKPQMAMPLLCTLADSKDLVADLKIVKSVL